MIRKIIRKLPSPHYSVILTSDKLTNYHYTPESVIEDTPEKFQIFSDIVHDPSREFDIERHDMYQQVEPDFRAPRHTNDRYLRNKKKDEIHLFNYELWKKNEQLIMTIAVMIIGLLFLKFTQLMKYVFTKGQNNNRNKKNGLLDKQD